VISNTPSARAFSYVELDRRVLHHLNRHLGLGIEAEGGENHVVESPPGGNADALLDDSRRQRAVLGAEDHRVPPFLLPRASRPAGGMCNRVTLLWR